MISTSCKQHVRSLKSKKGRIANSSQSTSQSITLFLWHLWNALDLSCSTLVEHILFQTYIIIIPPLWNLFLATFVARLGLMCFCHCCSPWLCVRRWREGSIKIGWLSASGSLQSKKPRKRLPAGVNQQVWLVAPCGKESLGITGTHSHPENSTLVRILVAPFVSTHTTWVERTWRSQGRSHLFFLLGEVWEASATAQSFWRSISGKDKPFKGLAFGIIWRRRKGQKTYCTFCVELS